MAYKRKRPTRRPLRQKRRRTTMKMTRRPRVLRPYMKAHRTVSFLNWTPATTTTADFWKSFGCTLGQVTDFTDFTNLYDQYKIYALKWTFRPRYDNFAGNDTTDTTLPGTTAQGITEVHVVNDPYCRFGPSGTYTRANLNTFLTQGNVRSYRGTRPFNVFHLATIDESVGALSQGARKKAPWIDTGNTNVIHYGFQAFAADTNLTGVFNQSWDVYVTFYMAFRGIR